MLCYTKVVTTEDKGGIKKEVNEQIEETDHEHTGVEGYRRMAIYLARKSFEYHGNQFCQETEKEVE